MKPRRSWRAALVLMIAAGALAAGVAELFELRFSAGDVYPPYSTLRSDPLGCKALYASLRELPGMAVERNLRPLSRRADAGEPIAFFHLGASAANWPELYERDSAAQLDRILRHGSRVVLAFGPTQSLPTRKTPAKGKEAEEKADLAQRWGIDFRRIDPKARAPLPPAASAATAEPSIAIEPRASWHSLLDFELDDKAIKAGWRALYRRSERPVLVARDYPGGGRLLLASDSYLFSNEALRNEPHPALLAELIGPARRAVFDETHFGISETPGWMALARRFHLEWAMAAVALLAGLFLWKSATSLVPAAPDSVVELAAGRDSATGFLNLVRRSVAPRELLATCVARWAPGANPAAVERVRAVLAAEAARPRGQRNLVAAYKAMCAAAGPQCSPMPPRVAERK